MNKKTLILVGLPLLCIFLPSFALGQIQARLRIIEASNVSSGNDPALRDIRGQLGSLFNFSDYRLLRDVNLNLVGNRPTEVQVHPGRTMEVTLVGEYRKMAELKIRLIREGSTILNTQVRLASGRTILIGGPRHGAGVLIFALSARF